MSEAINNADRMQAAMKSGFQTRDAEMNMARMLAT